MLKIKGDNMLKIIIAVVIFFIGLSIPLIIFGKRRKAYYKEFIGSIRDKGIK
jgi:hypothetical protein